MKKILTASLVAMMAVSAAHADIASTNYVDGKIGDEIATLDVTEERVAGSYVAFVNEADGKVASQKVEFDQAISKASTHDNAPTSKAVYDAINGVAGDVAGLDLTAAAEDGKYVSTVAQADGKVSQQLVAFDTTVSETSNNAPTSKAVYTAMITKEDVANKKQNLTGYDTLSPAEQAKLYPSIPLVKNMLADNLTDVTEITNDLQEQINDKQDESTANFQVGAADGTWLDLTATLPDACKAAGSECALVSVTVTQGQPQIKWSVVVSGNPSSGDVDVASNLPTAQQAQQ